MSPARQQIAQDSLTETELLRLVLTNWSTNLHTAMPGTIVGYDPASRRADVQGSIDRLMQSEELRPRLIIRDVPVLFPSSGDYSIRTPVRVGDSVLLIFSMRSLDDWKQGHKDHATPGHIVRFAEKDAIAIAGFGKHGSFPPVRTDGIVLQKDDHSRYLVVGDQGISIRGTTNVTGNLHVDGDITATGNIPVGDHTHAGGIGGTTLPALSEGQSYVGPSLTPTDIATQAELDAHTHSGIGDGSASNFDDLEEGQAWVGPDLTPTDIATQAELDAHTHTGGGGTTLPTLADGQSFVGPDLTPTDIATQTELDAKQDTLPALATGQAHVGPSLTPTDVATQAELDAHTHDDLGGGTTLPTLSAGQSFVGPDLTPTDIATQAELDAHTHTGGGGTTLPTLAVGQSFVGPDLTPTDIATQAELDAHTHAGDGGTTLPTLGEGQSFVGPSLTPTDIATDDELAMANVLGFAAVARSVLTDIDGGSSSGGGSTDIATHEAATDPHSQYATDADLLGKADTDLQNISATLSDQQKALVRTRIGAGTGSGGTNLPTLATGQSFVGPSLTPTDIATQAELDAHTHEGIGGTTLPNLGEGQSFVGPSLTPTDIATDDELTMAEALGFAALARSVLTDIDAGSVTVSSGDISSHEAAPDPHSQYATDTDVAAKQDRLPTLAAGQSFVGPSLTPTDIATQAELDAHTHSGNGGGTPTLPTLAAGQSFVGPDLTPTDIATQAELDAHTHTGLGAGDVADHEAAPDPHSQYATDDDLTMAEALGFAAVARSVLTDIDAGTVTVSSGDVTTHAADVDAHHTRYTDAEADARVTAGITGKADTDLQNISTTLSDAEKANIRTRIGAGTGGGGTNLPTLAAGQSFVGPDLTPTDIATQAELDAHTHSGNGGGGDVSAHEAAADPHSQYATDADVAAKQDTLPVLAVGQAFVGPALTPTDIATQAELDGHSHPGSEGRDLFIARYSASTNGSISPTTNWLFASLSSESVEQGDTDRPLQAVSTTSVLRFTRKARVFIEASADASTSTPNSSRSAIRWEYSIDGGLQWLAMGGTSYTRAAFIRGSIHGNADIIADTSEELRFRLSVVSNNVPGTGTHTFSNGWVRISEIPLTTGGDSSGLDQTQVNALITAGIIGKADVDLQNISASLTDEEKATIRTRIGAGTGSGGGGGDVTAHEAAADPHPVYATDDDVTMAEALGFAAVARSVLTDLDAGSVTVNSGDVSAHEAAPDPHSQYATDTDVAAKQDRLPTLAAGQSFVGPSLTPTDVATQAELDAHTHDDLGGGTTLPTLAAGQSFVGPDLTPTDIATQAELDAHTHSGGGTPSLPTLAAGQSFVGPDLTPTDIATQAELDSHTHTGLGADDVATHEAATDPHPVYATDDDLTMSEALGFAALARSVLTDIDAGSVTVSSGDVATHAADVDAHHTRYTDAEALAQAVARYTDAEKTKLAGISAGADVSEVTQAELDVALNGASISGTNLLLTKIGGGTPITVPLPTGGESVSDGVVTSGSLNATTNVVTLNISTGGTVDIDLSDLVSAFLDQAAVDARVAAGITGKADTDLQNISTTLSDAEKANIRTRIGAGVSDSDGLDLTAVDARVSAGITTHEGESDPHSVYATDDDLTMAETLGFTAVARSVLTDVDGGGGGGSGGLNQGQVDARVTAGVNAHESSADPHSGYATDSDLTNHSNTVNAHHTRYTDAEALAQAVARYTDSEKTKLAGIAAGAEVNEVTQAELNAALNGASISGTNLLLTKVGGGAPISVPLPSAGDSVSDGVVTSGSLNSATGIVTLTISTGGTVDIDLSALLNVGLDLTAVDARVTAGITTHAADDDAHHTRYTDTEADARVTAGITGKADTDLQNVSTSLTDTQKANIRSRIGAGVSDSDGLDQTAVDARVSAGITTHAADDDAHHTRYTDTEADARVTAGINTHNASSNPHSQYATDSDLTSHSNTVNAHHSRYTNAEADVRVSAGITTHESASDPHSVYATDDDLTMAETLGFTAVARSVLTDVDGGGGGGSGGLNQGQVDARVTAGVNAHEASGDPHSIYATDSDLSNHTSTANAHHTRYTDTEALAQARARFTDSEKTKLAGIAAGAEVNEVTQAELNAALNGASISGTNLLLTKVGGGAPISVPLPSAGDSVSDGVVTSGSLNTTSGVVTLTISTGGTVDIDLSALLNTGIDQTAVDARVTAGITTHAADDDAHHTRYTDAEADARVTAGITGKADTNLQNISASLTDSQKETVRTRIGAGTSDSDGLDQTAVDARVTAGINTHSAASDPHSGYATDADVAAKQDTLPTLASGQAHVGPSLTPTDIATQAELDGHTHDSASDVVARQLFIAGYDATTSTTLSATQLNAPISFSNEVVDEGSSERPIGAVSSTLTSLTFTRKARIAINASINASFSGDSNSDRRALRWEYSIDSGTTWESMGGSSYTRSLQDTLSSQRVGASMGGNLDIVLDSGSSLQLRIAVADSDVPGLGSHTFSDGSIRISELPLVTGSGNVTGLDQTAVDARVTAGINTHNAATDPHSGYATDDDLTRHTTTINAHHSRYTDAEADARVTAGITGKADTNLQNISDALTDDQKATVRTRIGAGTSDSDGLDQTAVDARVTAGITTHTNEADPHSGYATDSDLTSHTSSANAHHTRYTDTEADARVTAGINTHNAASNPHSQYATDSDLTSHSNTVNAHHSRYTNAEADVRVSAGITTHESASDPHSVYATDDDLTVAETLGFTAVARSVLTEIQGGSGSGGLNQSQVDSRVSSGVSAHEASSNPHSQYSTDSDLTSHSNTVNAHHSRYTDAEALAQARARFTDTEKTKLAGIAAGAEVNEVTQAELNAALNGASISGTNLLLTKVGGGAPISVPLPTGGESVSDGVVTSGSLNAATSVVTLTISTGGTVDIDLSDLAAGLTQTQVDARVTAGISTHTSASDPHSQYATDSDLTSHSNNANAHHSRYTDAEADARVTAGITGKADTNLQNISASLTDSQKETVRTRIGAGTSDSDGLDQTAVDARVTAGINTHSAASDPHSQYATDADVAAKQDTLPTLAAGQAHVGPSLTPTDIATQAELDGHTHDSGTDVVARQLFIASYDATTSTTLSATQLTAAISFSNESVDEGGTQRPIGAVSSATTSVLFTRKARIMLNSSITASLSTDSSSDRRALRWEYSTDGGTTWEPMGGSSYTRSLQGVNESQRVAASMGGAIDLVIDSGDSLRLRIAVADSDVPGLGSHTFSDGSIRISELPLVTGSGSVSGGLDQTAVDARVTAGINTHNAASDPHSGYATDTDLTNHTNNAAAHHTRYTDAEADLRAAARYTDTEKQKLAGISAGADVSEVTQAELDVALSGASVSGTNLVLTRVGGTNPITVPLPTGGESVSDGVVIAGTLNSTTKTVTLNISTGGTVDIDLSDLVSAFLDQTAVDARVTTGVNTHASSASAHHTRYTDAEALAQAESRYTDTEKTKLAGIAVGAQVNEVTQADIDVAINGASVSGTNLLLTKIGGGTPITVPLPSGGESVSDGVVTSGTLNSSTGVVTLNISTGGTVDIDLSALLNSGLDQTAVDARVTAGINTHTSAADPHSGYATDGDLNEIRDMVELNSVLSFVSAARSLV